VVQINDQLDRQKLVNDELVKDRENRHQRIPDVDK